MSVAEIGQRAELRGDRTYKLPSRTTSEPGRYVKSLGDPVTGPGLLPPCSAPGRDFEPQDLQHHTRESQWIGAEFSENQASQVRGTSIVPLSLSVADMNADSRHVDYVKVKTNP